jgi:hypothetical protein
MAFGDFDDRENQVLREDDDVTVHNTKWHNPTDHDVTLELHIETPGLTTRKVRLRRDGVPDKPLTHRERTGNVRAIIKAGQTIELSSEFDNAIQKVDPETNTIVSGLAPQLQNMGKKVLPKIASALDVQRQEALNAEKATNIAIEEKAIAEMKLKDALAKVAHLEATVNALKPEAVQDPRGQPTQQKKKD